MRLPGPMDAVGAVRDLVAAATELGRVAHGAIELVPRLIATLDSVDVLLLRADRALTRLEGTAVDADRLVTTAEPLVERLSLVLQDTESAVLRVDAVVDGAQQSITHVDAVVDGAQQSVTHVNAVVDGAQQSVTHVDAVVDAAQQSVTHVDAVVERAELAVQRVFDVLAGATGLLDTSDHLLTRARPAIERLLPVLQRFADTFDEHEVSAAIVLLDRLPVLLETVDRDLLPLAGALKDVGPELHSLLGLVEDLHQMVEGLPGMKLLRRKGAEG